jgi:hypothetical protein
MGISRDFRHYACRIHSLRECDLRDVVDLIWRFSGPSDVIEEIWTRDVVDITWEVLRWRRLKAGLLTARMMDALEGLLVRPLNTPLEDEFLIGYTRKRTCPRMGGKRSICNQTR